MLKKNTILLSLILTSNVTAQTPCLDEARLCNVALKACDEALNACDKALADSQLVIDAQTQILLFMEQRLKASAIRISDLEEAKNAWYRNPFLMTGLGIIVGGAGVLLIKR